MSWGEASSWLPTAAVAALAALGLVAVALQPWNATRRYWLAALALAGILGLAGATWERVQSRGALAHETERLQLLGSRLDELGRMLPAGPGKTPGETFETVAAAIHSLSDKIKELETQVDVLRQKTKIRAIEPDTAAKLAEYLRRFGSRRVVVSCAPDDVEAYGYANQIANILRAAGWDASGPERTAIFGEAASVGVKLFVRGGGTPPDTANLLIEAFTRFNIPFESGITPSDAMPGPGTMELFVSHKP